MINPIGLNELILASYNSVLILKIDPFKIKLQRLLHTHKKKTAGLKREREGNNCRWLSSTGDVKPTVKEWSVHVHHLSW